MALLDLHSPDLDAGDPPNGGLVAARQSAPHGNPFDRRMHKPAVADIEDPAAGLGERNSFADSLDLGRRPRAAGVFVTERRAPALSC
jgi:hypothetical protein